MEQIKLSNETIEHIKKYQENKFILYAIENILKDEIFINKLSSYLVLNSINNTIKNDDNLSKIYNAKFYPFTNIKYINPKYDFADLLEYLPILKQESIIGLKDKDMIYEYFYKTENEMIKMQKVINEDFEQQNTECILKEQEEFMNAEISRIDNILKSEQTKKFNKNYENYINKNHK